MAVYFEDKRIEGCVVEVSRSVAFRRLKSEVNDEANSDGGDPKQLAIAICEALREKLIEDLVSEQGLPQT